MKPIALAAVCAWASAAEAAPATYKKSGPDAAGVTVHWVKCENGNVSTAQCLKDDAHCGDHRDAALHRAAVTACDSIQGLIMVPTKK